MKNEIILQAGIEGGDITLYGVQGKDGWRFSREVIDQSALMLDEPAIQHESEVVASWEEALGLLDHYPWHRFRPLEVHPDFQQIVFEAVMARYSKEKNPNLRRLPDWKECCGQLDKAE